MTPIYQDPEPSLINQTKQTKQHYEINQIPERRNLSDNTGNLAAARPPQPPSSSYGRGSRCAHPGYR